jgi:glycosyltransferase involved in cell wall biosynthesis
MTPDHPYLSVIVPVKNGHNVLPRMLGMLSRSALPRETWELIVVDDGSSDDSVAIASAYADLVIRLPSPSHGPGYARNRGVERARGEIVVFLDADVVVRPDTLTRLAETMMTRSDVDAVFGAYCDEPEAAGVVSKYRNLLHHYTHAQEPGEAQTFWAGCGCVRRAAFIDVGMYDEWRFSRPQIEDVELGYRLSANGHRILLQPEIQVTHLKRWTFRGMLKADFMDRGVPWARLLAEQRALLGPAASKAKSLSLRAKEKSNTVFVCLGLLLLAISVRPPNHLLALLGALSLAIVVLRGLPLYAFFFRKRGLVFAICGVVLHMVYYLTAAVSVVWGAFLAVVVGEPRPAASVEAFSELDLASWPPVPRNPSKPTPKASAAQR